MTLWSGRFDSAPDPAAFDFGVSFGFDRALFEDDVTGSLAWAEALAAAGVLSADDARNIASALGEILDEGTRSPESVAGPDEDVHSFVERKLIEMGEKEVPSKFLGEEVMRQLHALDEVAYVRFASVYREFRDLSEFMSELKEMLDQQRMVKEKKVRSRA